jgi:glycosyltransferase involved in cell wall biosynthesis
LAKRIGCELINIEYRGITRYPRSILKTLLILWNRKPDVLFVQNPSMILATVACLYKFVGKKPVIVDRHTTFLLNKKNRKTPYTIIFKLLHRFTIRYADLTIVTNEFLASLVRQLRGKPFVLPDMIPNLTKTETIHLNGKYNILLISSFGNDEPIREAFDSAKDMDKEVYLYITGNYKKIHKSIYRSAPSNFIFTGYVEEQEFINMLFSVDAIMVLTTADYCMLCGCYEAIAACKPLITSNKDVLRDYFKGAVFVENTAKDILYGIKYVLKNIDNYTQRICALKEKLMNEWEEKYSELEKQIIELD